MYTGRMKYSKYNDKATHVILIKHVTNLRQDN